MDVSRIFRVSKKVFTYPAVRGDAHPLNPKLQLLACKLSGCSPLATAFRKLGVANLLALSWRPTTRKWYGVHICKWCAFGLREKLIRLHPSVNDVLTFLRTFYINQLPYLTINTFGSALPSYRIRYKFLGCHHTVANYHFIVRYLKGVLNCCNLTPPYKETRDVKPVPDYVELLFPLGKLSLKELTFKLVILLGQRCQTLSMSMAMAICPFQMPSLIGTLVRVQLGDGLNLYWKQMEWIYRSLKLIALDQELHREHVSR